MSIKSWLKERYGPTRFLIVSFIASLVGGAITFYETGNTYNVLSTISFFYVLGLVPMVEEISEQ